MMDFRLMKERLKRANDLASFSMQIERTFSLRLPVDAPRALAEGTDKILEVAHEAIVNSELNSHRG